MHRKNEQREEKWKKVAESKSMCEFRKPIDSFRPRTRRRGSKIKKERWTIHFQKLLEAEKIEDSKVNGKKVVHNSNSVEINNTHDIIESRSECNFTSGNEEGIEQEE